MIKKRRTKYYCGLAVALGMAGLALFFGRSGNTAAAAVARPTPTVAAKATPTPDAKRQLSSIIAVYTGKTGIVGQAIDLKKIKVVALYTDGSYETVTDYSMSQETLTRMGSNAITITYKTASTKIYINAKKLTYMIARYEGTGLTFGDALDREKIAVTAYYSDGTSEEVKDYTLSNNRVTAAGVNTFYVYYGGEKTSMTVVAEPLRLIKELRAYYTDGVKLVGEVLEQDNFIVTAIYNDDTMEMIDDYKITPRVVKKGGENTIVITKDDVSTEVTVWGRLPAIKSIEASYKGDPVVIGNEVKKEDFEVKVVYEGSGGKKEEVKDFTLAGTRIGKLGENNIVTIFFEGLEVTVRVKGIEESEVDYSNCVEKSIKDGNKTVHVKVALDEEADKDSVRIGTVSAQLVSKAMRKIDADKYMVMVISFDDPELSVYVPMTVNVTIPSGYDKKRFGVFYSSNRKTIVGKVNGELLEDGSYEFQIFQPGTYILANCTEKGNE